MLAYATFCFEMKQNVRLWDFLFQNEIFKFSFVTLYNLHIFVCQISCRINAVAINTTPKWSKSPMCHFRTEYAEGSTIAISDFRKNIMGFRISGDTFGAVNKIHFMGRDYLKNEE